MTSTAFATRVDLRDCDGFRVESPEGPIGWVEEVWLGAADEPRALAVRTNDGRRGLLAAADVVTVVPEHEWVVVRSQPRLLELAAPRFEAGEDSRVSASWRTTGAPLSPPPKPGPVARAARRLGVRSSPRVSDALETTAEPPLWQTVALLYACLAVIVASIITLAFVIADLLTGRAY